MNTQFPDIELHCLVVTAEPVPDNKKDAYVPLERINELFLRKYPGLIVEKSIQFVTVDELKQDGSSNIIQGVRNKLIFHNRYKSRSFGPDGVDRKIFQNAKEIEQRFWRLRNKIKIQ